WAIFIEIHLKKSTQGIFAKKNLDTQNAVSLQKEISDLQTRIDQNRIEHIIEMKKINPDAGRGFRGGGPMGGGLSSGHPCRQ
ncbi:MAG: hypothetical protein JRI82_10930, partial [Deltaproteobacteria bacterium]|nr:hypothetical protein [Deltaproteobacteria bacterium]